MSVHFRSNFTLRHYQNLRDVWPEYNYMVSIIKRPPVRKLFFRGAYIRNYTVVTTFRMQRFLCLILSVCVSFCRSLCLSFFLFLCHFLFVSLSFSLSFSSFLPLCFCFWGGPQYCTELTCQASWSCFSLTGDVAAVLPRCVWHLPSSLAAKTWRGC